MPAKQANCCYLPAEILTKIFLILPLNSIQACKLVSKTWKNATDDPNLLHRCESLALFHLFVNKVHRVSAKESTKTITRSGADNRKYPSFTVDSIPIDLSYQNYIDQLLWEWHKGVVCVVALHPQRILFRKLFAGDSNVTEADFPTGTKPPYVSWLYGFGYDHYADDCKMVMVGLFGQDFEPVEKEDYNLCWVYSLRNEAWKPFKGFPYAAYYWPNLHYQPCSFNGVLHWILSKRGQSSVRVILTYDLHTCRFGEMLLPTGSAVNRSTSELAELGGRLCYWSRVTPYRPNSDCILRVWTREYGVSQSWTSLLSIDLIKLSHGPVDSRIEPTRILYKCRNGRKLMLLVSRYYGTLYDIDNDRLVTSIQRNVWEKKRRAPKRIDDPKWLKI